MKAKITPFLLFNTEAETAAKFYASVFNGKVLDVKKYPEGIGMPAGTVMTATFEILGTTMTALNWGQEANYTETISFCIEPETQEEVDHYWNSLTADGGEEGPCGWLKDKFGVSWQVAPEALLRMVNATDRKKAAAAMQVMMKMKKIIIKDIEEAYNNA